MKRGIFIAVLASCALLVAAEATDAQGDAFPVCRLGQEADSGRCYPICKAGFCGTGSVCWERCLPGYADQGEKCYKDSAGWYLKDSYARGPGTEFVQCQAASFDDKGAAGALGFYNPNRFSMIVASDTQLPWGPEGVGQNREQTAAMNTVQDAESSDGRVSGKWPRTEQLAGGGGADILKPLGVIVNGDLTAFWHDSQVEMYEQSYNPRSDCAHPDVLQLPIFPGLGNHDYANNVRDCWGGQKRGDYFHYLRYGANGCAIRAVNYIRAMISCGTVSNFPARLIDSFDHDSLAYSWDIGDYHFVQLHYHPFYAEEEISISPSWPWLGGDLHDATKEGKKIVINMHAYWDGMAEDPRFLDAVRGATVVAVFAGHIHEDYGYVGSVPTTDIPVFRSGAADQNKFLLVEFADTYINVAVVDSDDGVPKFYEPEEYAYSVRVKPVREVPTPTPAPMQGPPVVEIGEPKVLLPSTPAPSPPLEAPGVMMPAAGTGPNEDGSPDGSSLILVAALAVAVPLLLVGSAGVLALSTARRAVGHR